MHAPSPRENLPYLAGFGGLVLLAVWFRSDLLLVMVGLLGVTFLVSYLWSRYALERVEYSRSFDRRRCFEGETVELTVELTNRKVLPVTYLSVDDTVPDEFQIAAQKLRFARIGKGVLRLVFGLAWYQKVIRHYKVKPSRRGYYRVGPAAVTGGDPFGFFTWQRELSEQTDLVVYPRIVELERLGMPTRRPFGDLRSNNRLFEDPMRFAGVRDYQQGDPLNRVHWKASAASGHLQVKLLDPSSNAGLALFLNTWGFELFWQGFEVDALETGCMVAASVANWANAEGIPFGLYANGLAQGWGMNLRLPPARGSHVLPQALEGLARLQMPSREPISQLLADEAPRLGYGTSVVVITRRVSDELAGAIVKVQRSGRPVTLILVGADEPVPALPGVRVYAVPGEEALHAADLS